MNIWIALVFCLFLVLAIVLAGLVERIQGDRESSKTIEPKTLRKR